MNLNQSIDNISYYDPNTLKTPDIQNLRNVYGFSNSDIGEKSSENRTSSNKKDSIASTFNIINSELETADDNLKSPKHQVPPAKHDIPHKKHKKQKSGTKKHKNNIGPWKLGKTLGKGSSGRVRLAKNQHSGKLAAVKIVPKNKTVLKKEYINNVSGGNNIDDEVFEEGGVPYGIEREIIIMKLVTHGNIMGLYEVWENKNELYLVLEYVDGGELFDHLVANGKFSESEAVYYFKQIVQGVSYLHKFNICHRDLKPENILLDKKNQKIKIADFGMAALELSDKLLETSCGSPHYASPEIVQGKRYNGSPSDVWSCGIILFALLAGHLPFNDIDIKKLLFKVQLGQYECPSHFSVEAKDLIGKMLRIDPKERIDIDEIINHPLLLKYSKTTKNKSNTNINNLLKNQDVIHIKENNLFPTLPIKSHELHFQAKEDLDQSILESLQILWHGISLELLVERLLSEDQNEEKIFYSLLQQYQANQHRVSSELVVPKAPDTKDKTKPSVSEENINLETPLTPKLNAVSRFSSFLSLSRLQFSTTENLQKLNQINDDTEPLKTCNINNASNGLGLMVESGTPNESLAKEITPPIKTKTAEQVYQHTKQGNQDAKQVNQDPSAAPFYPLKSISRRSLNLSSYLLHDIAKNISSYDIPSHKNEFSKICENLLFSEPEQSKASNILSHGSSSNSYPKKTDVSNTFKKMSLDPRLKKATLKNLSTFLPYVSKEVNGSSEAKVKCLDDEKPILKNYETNSAKLNQSSYKIDSSEDRTLGLGSDSVANETDIKDDYVDSTAVDHGKTDLTLALSDLRTTTTFNDLNMLLKTYSLNEDLENTETPSRVKNNNDSTMFSLKPKVHLPKTQSKRNFPTTKSFLFADLESSESTKDLKTLEQIDSHVESSESEFVRAKRKVVPISEMAEGQFNSLTTDNSQIPYTKDKIYDYRGSLYVSNKPDFDEISLNDISSSFDNRKKQVSISLESSNSNSTTFNINNLKLSPEKKSHKGKLVTDGANVQRDSYMMPFLDNNIESKRGSSYINRDSRLLEITIGDITNDNFGDVGVAVEDEKKRVTMLFDEDDKKFFEDYSINKDLKPILKNKHSAAKENRLSSLKKTSLLDFNKKTSVYSLRKSSKVDFKVSDSSVANVAEQKLHVNKVRRNTGVSQVADRKQRSLSNGNWFIRLVSRISSTNSSNTNKPHQSNIEMETTERKPSNSSLKKEEEQVTTTILHERLFTNKNISGINDINILLTKKLKFFESKYPFFTYSISCESSSLVSYNFFESENETNRIQVLTLVLEEVAADETVTATLSQFRNIADKTSDKIKLFNDISTYLLKII